MPMNMVRISRVERVIAELAREDALTSEQAAVVLEDAYVTVALGASIGLAPWQVLQQIVFLMGTEQTAQDDPPTKSSLK